MSQDFDEEKNMHDGLSEEVKEIAKNYDIDTDTAERAQELVDELGIDEDDAVELADLL